MLMLTLFIFLFILVLAACLFCVCPVRAMIKGDSLYVHTLKQAIKADSEQKLFTSSTKDGFKDIYLIKVVLLACTVMMVCY